MKTLCFSQGQIIFHQDDDTLTMYEIRSGCVGVYTAYDTEQEKQIAVLSGGQLLGELGMIEARPRSATAVALEDDTVLNEYSEEEFFQYLQDRPDQVFRILCQLSSRIRETDRKFFDACLALRESEEASRSGTEKSDRLNAQLETLSKESESRKSYSASLRSSFYSYVLEDIEAYGSKAEPVNASLFERLTVRALPPEDMHVNPEDEFAKSSVGPNDRIISDYVRMIPFLLRAGEDVFPEPIMVCKIIPDGYMILNGHHRWAAALKTGTAKLRAKIINTNRKQ